MSTEEFKEFVAGSVPGGALLMVGSGPRAYREEGLRSLASEPLWLLTHEEPSWELPYVCGVTVVPRLGAATVSSRLEFLGPLAQRIAREVDVAGVLTFEEMYTPVVNRLAVALGLPSFGAEAVEACRDKMRSRALLAAAGLRQPRSELVTDAVSAAATATAIGYPVVVKPRGLAGSIGVVMAEGPDDLGQAVTAALAAASHGAQRHGGALVEEMVVGPEISIDCAVVEGVVTPLFLARKRFGAAPYFEELGQQVDALDPLLADAEVTETLEDAHRALGVGTGMTHTEMRLTDRGPVIIEVNARSAGDLVPHTGRAATGIDLAVVAATVARGEQPDATTADHRVAANEVVYPPRRGTVERIVLPRVEDHPGAHAVTAIVDPGDQVDVPPATYLDRCAYVIASGASAEECASVLRACVDEVAVTVVQ
jgi:biotin carboxylase